MTPESSPVIEAISQDGIGQAIKKYIASEEFIHHARSENSQIAYSKDLTHFATFCQENSIKSLRQLKPADVHSWMAEMKNLGYSVATIARKIACLKGFLDWTIAEGPLPKDFIERIETESSLKFKVEKPARKTLTAQEQKDLIAEARKEKSGRDAALILAALKTGARCEEILSRNFEDVQQLPNGEVSIKFHNPAKNSTRVVEFDGDPSEIMRQYLSKQNLKPGEALFQPVERWKGERLTRQGFWQITNGYGPKIGVQNLSPTVLRNTFVADFPRTREELAQILGITPENAAIFKRLTKRNTTQT